MMNVLVDRIATRMAAHSACRVTAGINGFCCNMKIVYGCSSKSKHQIQPLSITATLLGGTDAHGFRCTIQDTTDTVLCMRVCEELQRQTKSSTGTNKRESSIYLYMVNRHHWLGDQSSFYEQANSPHVLVSIASSSIVMDVATLRKT